jgi:hypothetical protein
VSEKLIALIIPVDIDRPNMGILSPVYSKLE